MSLFPSRKSLLFVNSDMNNGFSIGVVLSFLLYAWLATTSELQYNEQTTDPEVNMLSPRSRLLRQAAFEDDYSPPTWPQTTECSDAILGAYLNLVTGRVLRTVNTSTIALCCEACFEDGFCTSWSRNRSSGACELVSAREATFSRFPPSEFDVGGFLGYELEAEDDPGSGPRPFVECSPNRGIRYPNGDVLARGSARTSLLCCETCRYSRDCSSWYYNNRNNRCILNRDTPASRSAPSRFEGGAF